MSTYVLIRIQESNIEFSRIFVIAVTTIQAIFAEQVTRQGPDEYDDL